MESLVTVLDSTHGEAIRTSFHWVVNRRIAIPDDEWRRSRLTCSFDRGTIPVNDGEFDGIYLAASGRNSLCPARTVTSVTVRQFRFIRP